MVVYGAVVNRTVVVELVLS